eukprot:gene245-3621_t
MRNRNQIEEDVTMRLLQVRQHLETDVDQGLASLDALVQQNKELHSNQQTTGEVQTGVSSGLGILNAISYDDKLNLMTAAIGFLVFVMACTYVLFSRSSILWPIFVFAFVACLAMFVLVMCAFSVMTTLTVELCGAEMCSLPYLSTFLSTLPYLSTISNLQKPPYCTCSLLYQSPLPNIQHNHQQTQQNFSQRLEATTYILPNNNRKFLY